MPHANIWIRKEDYELWQEIPNKSEFISNALKGVVPTISEMREETETYKQDYNDKIAIDAFNGDLDEPAGKFDRDEFIKAAKEVQSLTCKYGHPSKNGKSCNNIKCAYFG